MANPFLHPGLKGRSNIFGKNLCTDKIVKIHSTTGVPILFEECLSKLEKTGLSHVGLFENCNPSASVEELVFKLENGNPDLTKEGNDEVAQIILRYLRNLEESLLDPETIFRLISMQKQSDQRPVYGFPWDQCFSNEIRRLHVRRRCCFLRLIPFLSRIAHGGTFSEESMVTASAESALLLTCKADYTGGGPTELSFKRGDTIKLLEIHESGWFKGICHDKVGYFPMDFVGPNVSSDIIEFRTGHDFAPTKSGQIPLKNGHLIEVFNKFANGWWRGRCDDNTGHFPAGFTTEKPRLPNRAAILAKIFVPVLVYTSDAKTANALLAEHVCIEKLLTRLIENPLIVFSPPINN